LFLPKFLGTDKISVTVFNSNLYIQYHCLPLIRTVNNPDSACHSIILSIKLALLNMFAHQETGIKQTIKSPHLPCGLIVVASLGLNFKVLNLKTLKTIK